MTSDIKINKHINKALTELELVLTETFQEDFKEGLYPVGKLGRSIGLLREFQKPIFERNPHFRPPPPWDGEVEPSLTKEQVERVSELTEEQLKEIDNGLLSFCSTKYQKVAKVVGSYMSSSSNKFELEDLFYAQRIEKMVHLKSLESQGNLKFMRYSEIRLAKT